MEPTEDVPYTAPDFTTPDRKSEEDEDQPNKSVLLDAQQYLKEAIEEHNTMDVLDLKEEAKMNPTQQVAVHKLVITHLRAIKTVIDEKVQELK